MAMIPVIDGNGYINPSALQELKENNCTMPNLDRVIYNLGKSKDGSRDVLACIVYFIDGTKVTVKNSESDTIELEDHALSDGSTIKVPSKRSKEIALIYAIVKRMLSLPDADGKMSDSGLGRILNEIITDAYDSNISEAEAKIAKDAAKKAHAEKKANAKPKTKNPSLHETVTTLSEVVSKLSEEVDKIAAKLG